MTIDMSRQPELALPFEATRTLLDRWRRRDPGKTAIVDLDADCLRITWGEVADQADRIAQFLADRGIGRGDKIALLADENLEKLLIWAAVWRLGAVVCPLNVELNEIHIAELLEQIGPSLILCHTDLDSSRLVGRGDTPVLRFRSWKDADDEFFSAITAYPEGAGRDLDTENRPEDVAAVFCTSGTASKPKSVIYNHMSYWLSGLSTIDMLGLTADDRTLEYRSFGWNSAQILSLLPWLELGLTMHIAKRFSRSRFFGWIRDHGITFSAGVPTVVNMLLNDPPPKSERNVPTLRLMTCSTAPLSPDQWTEFERMYDITLLQLYGMSEAGWICGNRHYRKRMGTVGPPAKHQELAIIDANGDPCPSGATGEITVGGPQTCMATISPEGEHESLAGTRIRTGDIGVMDDDGFVTVVGRIKDLIIRGGVNIAPVEIDNVLLSHPKILEAAAVGVPHEIYGEEVVAYVTPRPGEHLSETDARSWCRETLPEVKSPKRFYFIDEIPRSDRGKVLRQRLREIWESTEGASLD